MSDDPITEPIAITPDSAWDQLAAAFPRTYGIRDGRPEFNFKINLDTGLPLWDYDLVQRLTADPSPRPTIWQRLYTDHWVMLVMYTLIIATTILIIIAAVTA